MGSKKYCLIFKWIIIGVGLIFLTGCSILAPKPVPEPEKPEVNRHLPPKEIPGQAPEAAEKPLVSKPISPKKEKPADPSGNKQSPMALAALSFSEQGQAHLKNKKPDEAIRVLERAVNLNPRNGENYYYLAEAWLMKGNAVQAKEFNHLAEIYMKTDPGWKLKIESQKDRVSKFK